MSLLSVPVIVAVVLCSIYLKTWLAGSNSGGKPIPGPKGLPIVGNLFQIPASHSWIKFKEWADQFGPIFQFTTGTSQNIVISTEKVANDLFRERGSLYSSRAPQPMAAKYLSGHLRPLLLPYNELWRTDRKLMHRLMMTSMANSYQPAQSLESKRLLYDLVRDPENYEVWLQRYSGGLIFRLGYGKVIKTGKETYLQRAIQVNHNLERIASPGAYLVDALPILEYVPYFLAPFKQEGHRLHNEELDLFRGLLRDARNEKPSARGTSTPSFAQTFITEQESLGLTEDQGAYVLGTLFEAGTGTTAAAMMSFILAMTLHQEWQQALWDELDKVVGDRMPEFEDIPRLPTVRAVIKEVLRWRPVTAGGVAHMLTKDDTYNGFKFSAGTIFHANQWAIHREKSLYPDPETFNPRRWLDPSYPTYREPLDKFPSLQNFSAFGFGRRMCPGINIAERSLYILTARIAWACKFEKARDKNGSEIQLSDYNYTSGFNVQPKPFPFVLTPRSELHKRIVEESYKEANTTDPLQTDG